MIRYWLRRRGLIVIPVPPDPVALRDAGRGAPRLTRAWLKMVADIAELDTP